jgi:hypothetical protein
MDLFFAHEMLKVAADQIEREPKRRIVNGWVLKSGVPLVTAKCDRQARQADVPDFPFEAMELNECFEVTPDMVGETDLLRTANIVSRAASKFKYESKDICGNLTRDFKTRQIRGRFVRCHRTY